MGKVSPWHRFVDAAVRGEVGGTPRLPRTADDPSTPRRAAEVRAAGIRGIVPRTASGLRDVIAARLLPGPEARVQGTGKPAGCATGDRPRRRTDLRLVPPALLAWAAAVAGVWLPMPALGVLIAGLLLAAVVLFAAMRRRRSLRHAVGRAPRSFLTTLTIALLLSAAIASHSAVAASQKHDGPVADAVAARSAVVVEAEIAGTPRQLKIPGRAGSDRWAVEATAYAITANGGLIRSDARLLLVGGGDWQHVLPGQRIRTTGKLRPADDGQTQAGTLAATTGPATTDAPSAWQEGPGALRSGFAEAAEWIGGDARGLLPGMVTGDTSRLDDQLESAMKTVGMTHLTAVSGANCSLILGALLLAARSIRLPRAPAAAAALSGLALFVLMVGPDASVLRAGLMGAIGLVSLSGGRTGRGLSFLCLAVIGLLMADPALGTSFSFLLSVLATLGIVTTGPRIMEWLPPVVPRWLAAGLAVPLSAQLLCGPVIVLLQPQFSSYALPANMVAAPLVAPVTILGTAAVPVVPLAPWAAVVPMAVAGGCSAGVAAVARFFSGLPGAALPWPEGPFGAATMAALSGCTLLVLWLVLHPRALWELVLATHRRTVDLLDLWPGFSGLDERRHRGSLRGINRMSGRNQEWPLRKKHDPSRRRQRPPPGAM
ncbi:competence protein ComEC [Arthrobacter sp. PvP023]|uniref:ComEC/Rec2 family competence protein n=1 Tax=Micrococcaceae TaxID=1268 RepID=UPI001AE6157E|nr:ComEC/Rec2 family competence protein [Arthrobacter sp. PvP023]MBP1136094.1 competence protein ComEC [Arthrobacter sp. PvP023]